VNNLPPLTGAILISNPRKDPDMAGYRRNAGRPKKRGKPYIPAPTTIVSKTNKQLEAAAKRGNAAAKKELSRRRRSAALRRKKSTKKKAANNPRNPENPLNAANQWIGKWMKRNKKKLAGKSGAKRMQMAWAAYRKLKRKPRSYTKGGKKVQGYAPWRSGSRRTGGRKTLTAWQKYVKANAGKGKSMSQLADEARKKGIIGKKATTSTRKKTGNGRRGGNAWTRFQKRNGGKGYTAKQLHDAYKKDPKATLKKKAGAKSTRKKSVASGRRVGSKGFAALTAAEKRIAKQAEAAKKRAAKKAAATKKRNLAKMRKLRAKGYSVKQIEMMKKHNASAWAAANGLALKNGLALDNPTLTFGELLSPAGLWDVVREDVAPVLAGAAIGGAAHAFASTSGVTTALVDGIDGLPFVGEWLGEAKLPFFDQSVTQLLPYSIQGTAVFLVSALAAGFAPPGAIRNTLVTTGASALAFGGGIDAFNFISGRQAGVSDEDLLETLEEDPGLEDLDLSGLALDNVSALGGLALDNVSALGGLALDNGYGDGFAWQTAPLQAMNNVSSLGALAMDNSGGDYGQASLADAYYSGADFSGEEGQALLNGRERFFRRFRHPAYRPKVRPGRASHHAGRPGHKWGWLVKMCGWPKVREIAALPPAQRLQVIKAMRQAAMDAYQQEMMAETVQTVEASTAAAPELAPAATEIAPAIAPAAGDVPGGAVAPGGPVGAYGDPALFMS
jgi:hypothetical protein